MDETVKKRQRAKYECPEALGFYIRFANLLTSKGGLSDFDQFVREAWHRKLFGTPDKNDESVNKTNTESVIEKSILNLQERLGDENNLLRKWWEIVANYQIKILATSDTKLPSTHPYLFERAYQIQRGLVNDFINFIHALDEIRKGVRARTDLPDIEMRLQTSIDQNNRIHIKSFSHLELLLNGIEYDRLRVCENCSNIFWATRKEKRTCSKKCSDILFQTEYRTTKKEEISKRRKENYRIKKNLERNKRIMPK